MENEFKTPLPRTLSDRALLRLPEVLEFLPICRSSFYNGIKKGYYPRPVRLGARTSAWRASDIAELIERLPKAV